MRVWSEQVLSVDLYFVFGFKELILVDVEQYRNVMILVLYCLFDCIVKD